LYSLTPGQVSDSAMSLQAVVGRDPNRVLHTTLLSYVDESAEKPSLVAGGGIPAEWCGHPMKVHGMGTRCWSAFTASSLR